MEPGYIYRVQTMLAPSSTWYNLILSTPQQFRSPHQTQSQNDDRPLTKSAGKRKKAKKNKDIKKIKNPTREPFHGSPRRVRRKPSSSGLSFRSRFSFLPMAPGKKAEETKSTSSEKPATRRSARMTRSTAKRFNARLTELPTESGKKRKQEKAAESKKKKVKTQVKEEA